MITFRGNGSLAVIGFIISMVLVAVVLRAVLGAAAADVPSGSVFGVGILISAVITAGLALVGMRGGRSNHGRHEFAGQPLERVAALETVVGVALIVAGTLQIIG